MVLDVLGTRGRSRGHQTDIYLHSMTSGFAPVFPLVSAFFRMTHAAAALGSPTIGHCSQVPALALCKDLRRWQVVGPLVAGTVSFFGVTTKVFFCWDSVVEMCCLMTFSYVFLGFFCRNQKG